jgi:hypothetical protein
MLQDGAPTLMTEEEFKKKLAEDRKKAVEVNKKAKQEAEAKNVEDIRKEKGEEACTSPCQCSCESRMNKATCRTERTN